MTDELSVKLKIERHLLATMRGLSKRLSRELLRAVRDGSPPPDLALLAQPTIESRLKDHFRTCERAFGRNLSSDMDEDIRPGKLEAEFIRIEILRILDARAERQSLRIARTLQNFSTHAYRQANNHILLDDDLTQEDLPKIVATIFSRKALAHAKMVSTTETQMGVETVKGVEAHMLVHHTTQEIKRIGDILTTFKVWRSQGDSRVRTVAEGSEFDHLAADGQRVRSSETFDVGGERLLWPGDISHGASAGNIINCRCSAIYDKVSFARLRRDLLGRLFRDVAQPFRPTESNVVVSQELGG